MSDFSIKLKSIHLENVVTHKDTLFEFKKGLLWYCGGKNKWVV